MKNHDFDQSIVLIDPDLPTLCQAWRQIAKFEPDKEGSQRTYDAMSHWCQGEFLTSNNDDIIIITWFWESGKQTVTIGRKISNSLPTLSIID